jgi:Divergent InlB B-repeat domain
VPRFDLAAFPCFPSLGALDISDVRLPHDASYYAGSASLFNALEDELVATGFSNAYKKYLVYYDSPIAVSGGAICGQGHEDEMHGGVDGYAEVYLAPNLTSGPTADGCGDIATPEDRGGYSAIVATHELLHTFGALETTSSPGPPHACPGDLAHSCDPGDNGLDIMRPSGITYWLDDTYLDFGNDDYYGMPASDTWWDVQDSVWLRHLNAPIYTMSVAAGAGVASITSDLPGVDCTGAAPCASTWDANTSVTLTAAPAKGYTRVQWGGACASTGARSECTVAMTAMEDVTVSYLKALAVTTFTAPRQTGRSVQVKLKLSRAPLQGEASITCRATTGLKLVAHAISGSVATCAWSVPVRLRGRRVTGHVTIAADGGTPIGRAWSLRLKR